MAQHPKWYVSLDHVVEFAFVLSVTKSKGANAARQEGADRDCSNSDRGVHGDLRIHKRLPQPETPALRRVAPVSTLRGTGA